MKALLLLEGDIGELNKTEQDAIRHMQMVFNTILKHKIDTEDILDYITDLREGTE